MPPFNVFDICSSASLVPEIIAVIFAGQSAIFLFALFKNPLS
jgi:hypothetical protein